MTPLWLLFVLMLYLFGGWLGAIYKASAYDQSTWETIVQFQIFTDHDVNLLITSFTLPWFNTGWFSALGDFFTWNSPIWDGWASELRMGLLAVGGVTTAILALVLIVGRISR